MERNQIKSKTTILWDTIRYLLTYFSTGVVLYYIGKYNLVLAVFAAIPVFIIMINLFGFLTLPLYFFTPESKAARKMLQSLEKCDMESFREQVGDFERDFNVKWHGDKLSNMPLKNPPVEQQKK
jgi:ABC-type multidrug transport system fused ATPase/permease subunit